MLHTLFSHYNLFRKVTSFNQSHLVASSIDLRALSLQINNSPNFGLGKFRFLYLIQESRCILWRQDLQREDEVLHAASERAGDKDSSLLQLLGIKTSAF